MQPTIHKSVTALDAEHKLSSAPSGTASPTPSNKHQIPCIFPDENEFQELTTHPTNKQLRRPSPDGAPHPSRPLEMQQNRSIEEQVHRLMHVELSGNPPRDLSAHRSLLSAPMEHPRDKNELIESLRCTPCDERHESGCRGGGDEKSFNTLATMCTIFGTHSTFTCKLCGQIWYTFHDSIRSTVYPVRTRFS
jgi:hypothetical protein